MDANRFASGDDVLDYLRNASNWGRWGDRGRAGAVNLITPEKRRQAAELVRTGQAVSLSRPWATEPSEENFRPAQRFTYTIDEFVGDWRSAHDYVGVAFHGLAHTHVDGLGHMWGPDGMWDGRDPSVEVRGEGVQYGGIEEWANGLTTRGVLLDIPRLRNAPYVTFDEPVHGYELREAAEDQGVEVRPGDAVLVYSGREKFAEDHDGRWAGHPDWPGRWPGLHASCLPFVRETDMAVLGWDMMDQWPNEYGLSMSVHAALFYFGVALMDNALLQPLAQACAKEQRYEFMLTLNPLMIPGATGSPANPVALL